MRIENKFFQLPVFLFFIIMNPIYPQIFTHTFVDTTMKPNVINTVFDKQLNTFQLLNSIDFRKNTLTGNIYLQHFYIGNLILSTENSYRDDETFQLKYVKPFKESVSLFIESNFLLSSDSRNLGINEAERLNGNIGLLYFLSNALNISTSIGLERNKQLNITSNGARLRGKILLSSMTFSNFIFNLQNSFELVKLQQGRIYSDLVLNSSLFGKFDDSNSMQLNFTYKNLSRDFISFPFVSYDLFEKRRESHILPSLRVLYYPFSKLFITLNVDVSSYLLSKSMSKLDVLNKYSALVRKLKEEQVSFNFSFGVNWNFLQPVFGLSYNYRNEENKINRIYPIDETSFNSIQQFESQKNNYQSRLNFFASTKLIPSKNDTLLVLGETSILRYDTPSKLNVDDRDEFYFILRIANNIRFSEFFLFRTELEYKGFHLVFLNSQRSLLNNWNRILRLSFSTEYRTEFFRFNPSFEILSNYTIYDFESKGFSVQNYLFRQILLKDSAKIFLSRKFTLEAQTSFRLLERGILYWKDFAMTKETEISEIFTRLLLFSQINTTIQLGIGARIYNIVQLPYTHTAVNQEYKFYSFSPETEIRIFIGADKSIFLQGWYEMKFLNRLIMSKISNIILRISYKI